MSCVTGCPGLRICLRKEGVAFSPGVVRGNEEVDKAEGEVEKLRLRLVGLSPLIVSRPRCNCVDCILSRCRAARLKIFPSLRM